MTIVSASIVLHDRFDRHLAVDLPEVSGGRFGLGNPQRDVLLGEQDLPVQVVDLRIIPVGDAQQPHAGPHKVVGDGGPESAAADQAHLGAL